ncbi:MAG: HEAT repeat domain-containing protein [Glaciecola sp.]
MALKIPRTLSSSTESSDNINQDNILDVLINDDINARRNAAKQAFMYPEWVNEYSQIIQDEPCFEVREALFYALQKIGNADVVAALIPLLSSEDVWIRNAVIEVLQCIPNEIEGHIIGLLNDRDSDVRIFAIDILQVLAHKKSPEWLMSVLKDEEHVNVVAAAVDRLAELGSPEMVPAIKDVAMRFRNEPYIQFACNTAIERMQDTTICQV